MAIQLLILNTSNDKGRNVNVCRPISRSAVLEQHRVSEFQLRHDLQAILGLTVQDLIRFALLIALFD